MSAGLMIDSVKCFVSNKASHLLQTLQPTDWLNGRSSETVSVS